MYTQAAEVIRKRIAQTPTIGLILGSGLGVLADAIEDPVYFNYQDLPGFSQTTVEGHKGRFVQGTYRGKSVIAMQGRLHYYEGKTMEEVTLPVRVMKALGVDTLIVTNAAGGIEPSFQPGDIMIISDHLNFSGVNPLRGPNPEALGPRFPDMSYAYDPKLRQLAMKTAEALDLTIQTGNYAMMTGPSYETPAEIRMLRIVGAQAVGMSTVPEVVTAVHAGMKVLGISCITNMAAGVLDAPLSHQEVIETADKAKNAIISLIGGIIAELPS